MLTDTGPKLLYDGNGKEMGSLFNVGLKMARQNQLFLMDGEADLINGAVNSLRSDFLFGLPVSTMKRDSCPHFKLGKYNRLQRICGTATRKPIKLLSGVQSAWKFVCPLASYVQLL